MWTRQDLCGFCAESFLDGTEKVIRSLVQRRKAKGVVFGASGGVDSLVCGALSVRALKHIPEAGVVGLQMVDSRIRGESYNPDVYRGHGVELLVGDITKEVETRERTFRMPPRWLAVTSAKLVLRIVPLRVRRFLILATKARRLPGWALGYFDLLTLPHKVRIGKLVEYAREQNLLVMICANRTEAELGYFVEQGVDDFRMGDLAPLLSIYKSNVIQVAEALGLPERIIHQRPSPGFGGIFDEEILGPYPMADLVLNLMVLGWKDREIERALIEMEPHKRYGRRQAKAATSYIRFIRDLRDIAGQKSPSSRE